MKARAFPKTRLAPLAALVSMSLLALSGCATKEFVQQQVGGVNSRIDTLQNLLKEASQRIDGNSVRLNYSEARLGKSEQTAAVLGKRIDDNLAGVASANHRLDGLSGDLAAASSRIASNSADIARAQQRLDATEEQVQASSRRLEGTAAGLALAEKRLGAAESTLQALSKAAPNVTAAAIAPAAQPETRVIAAGPVATLGDANNRLDSIAALVATANQRIAANSNALDNVSARLGSMEGGLGETRKRTEAGEQALAAANLRIDEMHGQIGEAKQTAAAQAAAIVAVDKRVDGVASALDTANTRIDDGDSGLTDTATRLDQLQAAINDESDRMSRHEADAAVGSSTFKHTLEGLGTTLEGVNKHMDVTDKSLADTGERVAQLQAAVKEQGSRLDLSEKGLAQTGAQVGQAVATLKDHEERLLRNESADAATSATAKEALERAIAAGRLAEGKLVYETVLSEALCNFDLEQAKLSEASKQVLKDFADKLRTENKNVFIEIQGHTDNTGPAAHNQQLARERAEAVRTFLHDSGGIPLHRMAVVAYGESRPVADNRTREGRMKNRRVALVVLR